MTDNLPGATDLVELVGEWRTLPDVADSTGSDVQRVRQALRDGQLLALRIDGVLKVPALLVGPEGPVKGLTGTLTLLRDAGYSDEEACRWLFSAEDTLPGTPAQALADNRGTEVKRRAQALGF